jgi:hypothetical protein
MTDTLKAALRAQRLPLGLIVLATLPDGKPLEYSFASVDSRDDFMRRVKVNGGACEIITP